MNMNMGNAGSIFDLAFNGAILPAQILNAISHLGNDTKIEDCFGEVIEQVKDMMSDMDIKALMDSQRQREDRKAMLSDLKEIVSIAKDLGDTALLSTCTTKLQAALDAL